MPAQRPIDEAQPPVPSLRIWRPDDFRSIELHHGAHITQEFPRHWHDELYLCAVLDGSATLECSGATLATPRGSLAVLPPGEIHANRKIDCTFRVVFIEFAALHSAIEQLTESPVAGLDFRAELLNDPRTLAAFLRLHCLLDPDKPLEACATLHREHALLAFLHRLAARHSTARRMPERQDGNEDFALRRTKQFLDNHYAERVSLGHLALLTGLSPYHLNRSFCRKFGMPPHAYQVQVRIARARALLRRGLSISDTASLTGFVDQSHFTRHFKRSMGITPGQYVG